MQESYLSERHYDEPPLDEDSYRLLNFGDDYRNYINSLSEASFSEDNAGGNGNVGNNGSKDHDRTLTKGGKQRGKIRKRRKKVRGWSRFVRGV